MTKKRKLAGALSLVLAALLSSMCLGACSDIADTQSSVRAETDGIRARASEDETRTLVTVMYHNILKSRSGTYIVTPDTLDADLSAFEEAGFETVFPSEIAAFVCQGAPLPEKPLLITFDDGRYNNMYYALPLLKKHDAKAAFFPVGAFSEFSTSSGDHSNPNYSHITWRQMKELAASGAVELGNHSYDMHRYSPRFGVRKMAGESESDYKAALMRDAGKMQDALLRATGSLPCAYAYPFGAYSDVAHAVFRSLGIKVFLTCTEGATVLKRGDEDTLSEVCRINRDGGMSTAQLMKKLSGCLKKA